jgi:cyclic beta-1,2-glucan synthetase
MQGKPNRPNRSQPQGHPEDAAGAGQLEDLARQHARARVVHRGPALRLSLLGHLRDREQLVREAAAIRGPPREPLYAAGLDTPPSSPAPHPRRLPPGFYRRLHKLDSGSMESYPRIYAVAQELVLSSGAHLDPARVERFIHLYQDITPLTIGELWALPAMLRLGILECLAQTLARITGLERKYPLPDMSLPQVKDDELVATCILSLRALAVQDWQVFFENVSRVEQVLREDPAGVYAGMDRETRDRYRNAVETLARGSGKDEQDVARAAVDLARGHVPPGDGPADILETPRAGHAGFYLIDAGRARSSKPGWGRAFPRARLTAGNSPDACFPGRHYVFHPDYFIGGTGPRPERRRTVLQMIMTIAAARPRLSVSVGLVNWIITLFIPPRVLPKMTSRTASREVKRR